MLNFTVAPVSFSFLLCSGLVNIPGTKLVFDSSCTGHWS